VEQVRVHGVVIHGQSFFVQRIITLLKTAAVVQIKSKAELPKETRHIPHFFFCYFYSLRETILKIRANFIFTQDYFYRVKIYIEPRPETFRIKRQAIVPVKRVKNIVRVRLVP